MIEVCGVTKRFGSFAALDGLSCSVPTGAIYGLVGSNGAGKSTLLRLIAGIYHPDDGSIAVDGQPVYENPAAKELLVLVPDELFFLPQASMRRMAVLYSECFPGFSTAYFESLTVAFQLNPTASIGAFSKGMKRQVAIILALACQPRYLLLDEAFDGLDPMMRNLVRAIIARDVTERSTTVVISSHSLRELEDTCDWLALLHKGSLIFESTKAELQAGQDASLEDLFVRRLSEAGYSFETALDAVYAPVAGVQPAVPSVVSSAVQSAAQPAMQPDNPPVAPQPEEVEPR